MKFWSIFSFLLLFVVQDIYSQDRQGFSYQAVVRGEDGNPISNEEVLVAFSIIDGTDPEDPITLYQETQRLTTNDYGLIAAEVGKGNRVLGNFFELDWSNLNLYLQIHIDLSNNQNFTLLGSNKILPIPIAFYALRAGNSSTVENSTDELQTITLSNDTIYLSDGGFVVLPSGIIDTDQQKISSKRLGDEITIYLERGDSIILFDQVMDADSDSTNELQIIEKNDGIISLSKNGGFFRDSVLTEELVDSFTFNNGFLLEEKDSSVTNELQTISISQDTIYLSDGGFAVLPPGFIDTDQQKISSTRTGSETTIFLERGDSIILIDQVMDADSDSTNELQTITKIQNTVILSNNGGSFVDSFLTEEQVDRYTSNNGYLIEEIDGSTTNELQAISISNDTIYLTDGGFVVLPPKAIDADSQSLSLVRDSNEIIIYIERGDSILFIDNVVDTDADSTNELQTITKIQNTVILSNDGGSFVDSVLTEEQVDEFVSNNGYLIEEIDGSISNEIQAISISNDTIYLSEGGFAVLPPGFIDTDQQKISISRNDNEIIINLERGDSVIFNDQVMDDDSDPLNEIQTISKVEGFLVLSNNGGSIRDSVLSENQVDQYVNNNGYLLEEIDGSTTNELQTITKIENTVILSNNGGSFRDSVLTEQQVDEFTSNNGYLIQEIDGSITNELQTISMSNDTIYLTDGGFIKLPIQSIDTDEQNLSSTRSGNQVTISIERGSSTSFIDMVNDNDSDPFNEIQTLNKIENTVILSNNGGSFRDSVLNEAQVDAFVNNNGYLTFEIDGSTTNELQTLSREGSLIVLSNNGGSVTDSVLDESQVDAFVSNNGFLLEEKDSSITNELQTLTLSNDTIYLSDGGFISLPGDTISSGSKDGQILFWQNNKWNLLDPGLPGQQLIINENEVPFWIGDSYPVVSTISVDSVTATSVIIEFNVSTKSQQSLISLGIAYNTNGNPTIEDLTELAEGGTGTYRLKINDLLPNNEYYVRAFGQNSIGIGYGNELTFTTSSPSLPIVSTSPVTSITDNSSLSGGIITFNGGSLITERGVVWSKRTNPTISDNKTSDGTGIGTYNSNLTGLEKDSIYYIRAYATNSEGTSYGDEESFTASTGLIPIVATNDITNLTNYSAESGGEIISNLGDLITSKGMVWSTSPNPNLEENNASDEGSGNTNFVSTLTDLEKETTYYYRAYATNSSGTGYGDQKSFITRPIPTIILDSISIQSTSILIAYANIEAEGGGAILEKGIVWDTKISPTVNNNLVVSQTEAANFNSEISGLPNNQTIFLRAYAVNSFGVSYSNELKIKTGTGLPTLKTESVSVSNTSALSGGMIIDNGGSIIYQKGIVWNILTNPTLENNKTMDGTGSESFTSILNDLEPNTTYYIRAYATNDFGTAYGDELTFTTTVNSTIIEDIDGNQYHSVEIGTQTWLSENLKTTKLNDGTPIPYLVSPTSWRTDTLGAWTYYNHESEYDNSYGKLYNAYSIKSSNICPIGWHIPTNEEWNLLIEFLGGNEIAANKLKKEGKGYWLEDTEATNEVSFNAVPGGLRDANQESKFSSFGYLGNWWSLNLDGTVNALLLKSNTKVSLEEYSQNNGVSIRCIKD